MEGHYNCAARIRAKIIAQAFAVFLLVLTASAGAFALPPVIWESSETSVITGGVTLERINRFTHDGWLRINVMRVDLGDKYLSLNALYNSAAIQELTPVKTMADRQGAVAAVNGGYFEWNAGWGGSAIGTAMMDGRIDTAFSGTNAYGEVMCSLTVNKLNEVLIGYCKPTIVLKAGATALYPGSYNKKTFYDYYDISIIDRRWAHYSVGATEEMPDIVELVVEKGVVREARVSMPAIVIPVDGFVAVGRVNADGTHLFSGKEFSAGSPVQFSVSLNPSLKDAVMHMEGASMLVRDGVIPDVFTFEPDTVSQRNPRSMIGCSKDGRGLLFVNVDGRQATSFGLSTYESAELMMSLGAYNAFHLDGGGSATMVARTPGTNDLAYVNSPSDGSPRPVVNGIGVFTNAPKAAVKGIIIDVSDANVFAGTSRHFTVRAYDRNYNPVKINANDVAWSVSGIRGKIENGVLTPVSEGEGVVRAKVGRASATVKVKVLSNPSELLLNSASLTLKPGESHTFAVIGRDRMGFSARINSADITWSASADFGAIDRGVFTRKNETAGYIAAAFGNAVAYCAVQPVPAAAAAAGPAGGAAAGSPGSPGASGSASATGSSPSSPSSGSPSAPGSSPSSSSPSSSGAPSASGASSSSGVPAAAQPPVKLPPATRIADKANRQVDYQPSGAAGGPGVSPSYRFGVLGEPGEAAVAAAVAAAAQAEAVSAVSGAFSALINKSMDCGLFVGSGSHAGAALSTKPAYVTGGGFEVISGFMGDPSRTLIRLSTAGNGIRAAGREQWGAFFAAMKAFTGTDLFIMLQQGPSTFKDKQEAALFKRTLADYTRDAGFRIWVFYAGPTDSVWLEDGVRYFSCAGAASASADKATGAGAKFLEVTVIGGEVTYVYKPLI